MDKVGSCQSNMKTRVWILRLHLKVGVEVAAASNPSTQEGLGLAGGPALEKGVERDQGGHHVSSSSLHIYIYAWISKRQRLPNKIMPFSQGKTLDIYIIK